MARKTTWGTPGKTEHYVFPRPRFGFLRWGLLLVAVAVIVGALLLFLPGSWGLRTLVSPGELTQPHADFEPRCQHCHLTRGSLADRGVANTRCERCHDAAAGGTLGHLAHVRLARARDRSEAEGPGGGGRFDEQECAACHVEHRGRGAKLKVVDEAQCRRCHVSYSRHPELYYVRQKQEERTGLVFNHKAHLTDKGLRRFKATKAEDVCVRCHEPNDQTDDFFPVSYDRHCADCHTMLARPPLGRPMEPVSARYVTAPSEPGGPKTNPDDFQVEGETILKIAAVHRDEWILPNIRSIGGELYPSDYDAERARLMRLRDRLSRRLELSTPLAELAREDLETREATLLKEIENYDGRLRASRTQAVEPALALERVRPILEALASAGEAEAAAEAAEMAGRLDALRRETSTAALPSKDFEERRRELVAWLGRLEEWDPSLKGRLDSLRRRLDALLPGESSLEMLARVREQRARDLRRTRDERDVREEVGLLRPSPVVRQERERPFREALQRVEARLEGLPPAPAAGLPPAEREAKARAFTALQRACDYCHVFSGGMLESVVAARPVLRRAKFTHEAHVRLRQCAFCHAQMEASERAGELHLPSLRTCRECHNPRQGKQSCQMCHLYHPLESP